MTDSDRPRCEASGCDNDASDSHPFCSVSCWISDTALRNNDPPPTAALSLSLIPDGAQAMLDVTDAQLAAAARAIYGVLVRAGFRSLCVSSKGTLVLPEVVETLVVVHSELRERMEHYEKLATKYLKQRDELGVNLDAALKRLPTRDIKPEDVVVTWDGVPLEDVVTESEPRDD